MAPNLPLFPAILKFLDTDVYKIFHNGRFDITLIEDQYGLKLTNIGDTMLAANVMAWPAKLAELAYLHLNVRWPTIPELLLKHLPKKQQLPDMLHVPSEQTAYKCACDAYYTIMLWHNVLRHVVPKEAYELELQTSFMLDAVERRGMKVDLEILDKHLHETTIKFDALKLYIQDTFGIENPGSGIQVGDALIKQGFVVKKKTKTGNYILDEKALGNINSELASAVLQYRKQVKLRSTYILPIKEKFIDSEDRIHPNINHGNVSTGRFSRSEPNVQNIPPIMRDMYIADKGHYLEAWDLSQIELRVIAWYCEVYYDDPTMANIFRSGQDIHEATGNYLNISRRDGKTFNFAIAYGAGAGEIASKLGISNQDATSAQNILYTAYPGINKFKADTNRVLLDHGYSETRLGRKRRYERELARGTVYWIEKAKREAFNARIQGTAGEDLKRLMVRTSHYPQINTIHDEILFEVPNGVELETTGKY